MQWDDLRFFLAVARSGSLAEAAKALQASPATVGRRVTALEEKLGTRLFHRRQSGFSLTESGLEIREKAEEVESSVLRVERSALGRDHRPSGVVRLATSVEVAANLVLPHLSAFVIRFPRIVLDIVGDITVANLTKREADVALRTVRPEGNDLVVRRVGNWKCAVYASKGYADKHGLKPGMIDFSNLDLITWSEKHAERKAAQWLNQHAASANTVLRANSRRLHYMGCKNGLGVAILPCVIAGDDPDLVQLLAPEQVYISDLYMVFHQEVATTARVRAVVDFFSDRISKATK